ncbi:citrate synthase [Saccharothrix carnea]|uniref:citrate synthase (unknown stereospecificity) n=1 Tax=Saccharothrix carnea TaxID=1280637 RepID=A0A2P8HZM8_SACCR|nr:citrate synthase [Saccharothrix carnea]PSL51680.1 citrate synthase [Saccharothrix carnea]
MPTGSDERYLTTAEVARRLGVKTQTVYAYASRGLLRSVRLPGRRGSFFAQSEVDAFVARGRDERQPSGAVERIRTELTLLDDDELRYRGHRATDLASSHTFESVATLLWTGEPADEPFPTDEALVGTVRTALAALPDAARTTDRFKVAAAVLGATDPLRFDLSPGAVVRVGRRLIGVFADALPGTAGDGDLIARRLAGKLGDRPVDPALLDLALVLLADHDLAVSTVAVRVAASARAHPYSVVSAGLGAVDGQYHGVASTLAYRFLRDAADDPFGALAERQRTGGVPGFGHRVYQSRDPRAEALFAALRRHEAAREVMATVDVVAQGAGTFPNVDLALAALMHAYRLRPDAGEAIFALARCAGWLAHAIEEYREPGLRFRPVGVYTGERPER